MGERIIIIVIMMSSSHQNYTAKAPNPVEAEKPILHLVHQGYWIAAALAAAAQNPSPNVWLPHPLTILTWTHGVNGVMIELVLLFIIYRLINKYIYIYKVVIV